METNDGTTKDSVPWIHNINRGRRKRYTVEIGLRRVWILELSQRDRSLLSSVINEGADATTQPNWHFVTVRNVEGRVLDETNTFGCASESDRTRFKGRTLGKENGQTLRLPRRQLRWLFLSSPLHMSTRKVVIDAINQTAGSDSNVQNQSLWSKLDAC